MTISVVSILGAVAFVPMVLEAVRSSANERALRAMGATEPAGDVYRAMQLAYPGCFLAMIVEAWLRHDGFASTAVAGFVVFAAAKAIKYWAIATLGDRWTFRVLVPPGAPLKVGGPYRYLRHPNYVGVAGEIAGFALLAGAPLAGLASVLLFGLLLRARIAVEERALGLRSR